jgi:hypothetical protein
MSNIGKRIIEGLQQLIDDLRSERPIKVTKVVRTGGKVRFITGTTDKPTDVVVREADVKEP